MKKDDKHSESCVSQWNLAQSMKYFQRVKVLLILLCIQTAAFAGTGDKVTVSGGTSTAVGANGDYYYAGTTTLNGVTRAYYDKPSTYYRVEFRYNSTYKIYEWEVWESTDLGGSGIVRFYNSSSSTTVPTGNWALDVGAGIPVVSFTAAGATPVVSSLSPQAGLTTGGTSVIITGTGFTGTTAVKFGTTSASSFTVNSASSITAVSPAGTVGTVDITVTNSNGTSTVSSADKYNYIAVPTASTLAATSVTNRVATLNGSINANNASTVVSFEYGTTTSYGTTVTADLSPISGTSLTSVSKGISGLLTLTTYHYRVVAVNAAGTTYGADQTFTTSINTGLNPTSSAAYSIYPNPATTSIAIDMANKTGLVTIYDLSGKTVMSQQINGKGTMNISHLTKGVYIIKAQGWTDKLIVQ